MTIVTFVRDAIESSGKDAIYSDTRSRALKKNRSARDVVALSIVDFFGADAGVSIHLPKRSKWEGTISLSPLVEDPIKPPE